MKGSLLVYSLVAGDSSIGTKNTANLYVGVPMADKIGLKDKRLSVTILWTLAEPYIIQGLEHERIKRYIVQWRFIFCLQNFEEHRILDFPYG